MARCAIVIGGEGGLEMMGKEDCKPIPRNRCSCLIEPGDAELVGLLTAVGVACTTNVRSRDERGRVEVRKAGGIRDERANEPREGVVEHGSPPHWA